VLILLNLVFMHGYFFFKAKRRLEDEINSLPNDAEAVIQKRSAELKNVRKTGRKISFELAASTLKLSELLADEKEDLWNVVSPHRFDIAKTWYRGFQIWNLAIADQGVGARIVGIGFILFAVTTFWGIVGVILWSFVASQFETQLGVILEKKSSEKKSA